MRPGVVAFQPEVLVLEVEDAVHVGVEVHRRQRARRAFQLQAGLGQMVEVEMRVARGVDEFAGLQLAYLRHHQQQEGIARDVEGNAQERVGRALVELEREFSVGHVKLEQQMAGWQIHAVEVGYVPCRDDEASGVRIFLDLAHHFADLVNVAAVVIGPRAPLVAIDVSQTAVGVGPFVPDADAVVLQVFYVGVAVEEPQQFVDNRLEVQLLGGEQGETVGQVEAHLMPEDAQSACTRTVAFRCALVENAAQEVLVLFHGR